MSNGEVKQRSFRTIQGVALLIAVGVITSGAWLVYNQNQKAREIKQTSNAAVTTTASTSTTETPVLVQQAASVANQNVEKIPELGIQITVPDGIKDLKYQVHTGTLQNGNQATFAFFSTAALTSADAHCGPSDAPLGSLERGSGQYPSSDQLAVFKYGQLVKQFPTFYISAGVPQAACSTTPSKNAAAVGHRIDFEKAQSSIQQSN